jgi:hypothetical protein
MRFFLPCVLFAAVTAMLGCVTTVPNVAANGRFALFSFQGYPALEFEHPDAQSCAADANAPRWLDLDANARKSLSEGLIKLECNPMSAGDKLKHLFKSVQVLTGRELWTRTVSYDACLAIKKSNEASNAPQPWKMMC